MKLKKKPYQKYTTHNMHELLSGKFFSEEYREAGVVAQPAFFCPYYIPLKGVLGFDWGVIVNPTSPKFGHLVFEHDGCGCSHHEQHYGNQRGTSWIAHERKKRLWKTMTVKK